MNDLTEVTGIRLYDELDVVTALIEEAEQLRLDERPPLHPCPARPLRQAVHRLLAIVRAQNKVIRQLQASKTT